MNPVKFSDLFESWLFDQSALQANLRLKLKRTALNMQIKLLYNCNLLSQENNAKRSLSLGINDSISQACEVFLFCVACSMEYANVRCMIIKKRSQKCKLSNTTGLKSYKTREK